MAKLNLKVLTMLEVKHLTESNLHYLIRELGTSCLLYLTVLKYRVQLLAVALTYLKPKERLILLAWLLARERPDYPAVWLKSDSLVVLEHLSQQGLVSQEDVHRLTGH